MTTVDISGPDGNAFSVMSVVTATMRQLGYSPDEIEIVMDEMKASDYDHLIATANDTLTGIIEFVDCREGR